jgi:hypothetical protein
LPLAKEHLWPNWLRKEMQIRERHKSELAVPGDVECCEETRDSIVTYLDKMTGDDLAAGGRRDRRRRRRIGAVRPSSARRATRVAVDRAAPD